MVGETRTKHRTVLNPVQLSLEGSFVELPSQLLRLGASGRGALDLAGADKKAVDPTP